jgi:unsaturated rhamnogalacturonyl hydrolase
MATPVAQVSLHNFRLYHPVRFALLKVIFLALFVPQACSAQADKEVQSKLSENSWAVRMADSFMKRHPDEISYEGEPKGGRWAYEQGVMLEAMRQMWVATGDNKFFRYIKKNVDQFVTENGSIKMYDYGTFNLDNIATGRQLLTLYENTHEKKYKIAADTLRKQLANQPRTHEGGFWHKKIYPFQMWLDGIYMAEPFYAEYAHLFNEPDAFDDIAHQIISIESHTRDPKSGLLYHGWDESRQQRWANPITGCSPNFWGRAMGWYAMGIVDVLDYFPQNHPKRKDIVEILQRLANVLVMYQDSASGLWYQVIDQGDRKGNYLEASASCMFAYAFAKGAKKGYLDAKLFQLAEKAFRGTIRELVAVDKDGLVNLHQTCQSAGLGGKPYRDGSYEYYISEPQRTNDFKAIGPFIYCALQVE